MSFWVGFAKAQGIGAKVALSKTLTFGDEISFTTYDGSSPIITTISELAKVDLAILQVLSSAVGVPGGLSTEKTIIAQPIAYSGNTFAMILKGKDSAYVSGGISRTAFSGVDISGVLAIKGLFIGEAKRQEFI